MCNYKMRYVNYHYHDCVSKSYGIYDVHSNLHHYFVNFASVCIVGSKRDIAF